MNFNKNNNLFNIVSIENYSGNCNYFSYHNVLTLDKLF